MPVKIVSQQSYYHLLRENMELKNMNGFCGLTREDAKEIDGGHDRAHRNHNRLTGSRKSAASAQWTTMGWAVSAIGVALAVPSGGTSIAFASLGVALAIGCSYHCCICNYQSVSQGRNVSRRCLFSWYV